MTRRRDWQTRYETLFLDRLGKDFEWGKHDCCLWAADTVLALTGQDFAKDLRGTYSTALEAARVLQDRGGVQAIATAALGEPIDVKFAAVGDIICIDDHGRIALAVCNGETITAVGLSGLESLYMSSAVCAWKV